MPVIVDRGRNLYVGSISLSLASTGKTHPPMAASIAYTLASSRQDALTIESLFVANWLADLLRCAGSDGAVSLHPARDFGVEPA